MPDTHGFRTPFKDYVATKMPFDVKDTLGNEPTGGFPIPAGESNMASAPAAIDVTALPKDNLHHGTPDA